MAFKCVGCGAYGQDAKSHHCTKLRACFCKWCDQNSQIKAPDKEVVEFSGEALRLLRQYSLRPGTSLKAAAEAAIISRYQ